MRRAITILGVFLLLSAAVKPVEAQKVEDLKFYDVKTLIKQGDAVLLGQATAATPDSCFYYRLPGHLCGVVREALWNLGKDGAGIAIRFSTDARCIGARWTLTKNFSMAHMPATGIKGLDLYVLDVKYDLGANSAVTADEQTNTSPDIKNFSDAVKVMGDDVKGIGNTIKGKLEGLEWKYAGTAFPNGKESKNIFVKEMKGERREYIIYLPLYDGIEELELGIESSAKIYPPSDVLVPKYKRNRSSSAGLPIVFYGTSVTQGGCASRPGMAYPSIISRALERECINLGFSGNGRMDSNMADFIATIPASAYVIDCLANCTYSATRDSSAYFIGKIASSNPDTPVYMVSNYNYPQQFILPANNSDMKAENTLWKEIYKDLSKNGTVLNGRATGPLSNLKYIDMSDPSIIGNEDTVDGTHLTDMGFVHFAEEIIKHIK